MRQLSDALACTRPSDLAQLEQVCISQTLLPVASMHLAHHGPPVHHQLDVVIDEEDKQIGICEVVCSWLLTQASNIQVMHPHPTRLHQF